MQDIHTIPDYLTVAVNGEPYRVRIVEEIIGDDGVAVESTSAPAERLIFISADCPHSLRYSKLVKELTGLWATSDTLPRTMAALEQFNDALIQSLQNDLAEQGGRAALLILQAS